MVFDSLGVCSTEVVCAVVESVDDTTAWGSVPPVVVGEDEVTLVTVTEVVPVFTVGMVAVVEPDRVGDAVVRMVAGRTV